MKKFILSFLSLVFLCAPVYAEEDISDELVNGVKSCSELLSEIEESDCGARVLSFFQGGHISLGIQASSLVVDIKKNEVLQAGFAGDYGIAPYYSITSGRNYYGSSNLGYEYSFVYDSSYGFRQKLTRGKISKEIELDTYAVGSIFAAQTNLFYSFGANDDTPLQYSTLGIGLGLGYGSTRGTYYETEDINSISPACDQAVTERLNGQAPAENIRQNCKFGRFQRSGVGLSARLKFDGRWDWFYIALETSSVNLLAKAKLVSGDQNGHDYSTGVSSIIFAYLYDF